ncbi:DUF6361 family protein [Homoserinimonas sp. A447]
MPSLVAWLDASSEDQRRMREIVNLFSERDSRDELGIGQIRDALSDKLFPGTSTLLTRARYMLLIPWTFVAATRYGADAEDIERRIDKNERNLIVSLKRDTDGEGLLGRTAGAALKTLPSSIYWVALRQYGILIDPSLSQADAIAAGFGRTTGEDDLPHPIGPWSGTLPPLPDGFPENTNGGFDLNKPEAGWLHDRMLEGAEGSLLAHLVDNRPQPESAAPWFDPATIEAPSNTADELHHAQMFSLAMHGASLLYNLLLAEAYEAAGYDRISGAADAYRERLVEWQTNRDVLAPELALWRRNDFWTLVYSKNPRINNSSRVFVDAWLDAVTTGGHTPVSDNSDLRAFIDRRERRHKGPQARLQNPRLLQSWQGASGAGALTYRWRQVRGILIDLHDGLERDDA